MHASVADLELKKREGSFLRERFKMNRLDYSSISDHRNDSELSEWKSKLSNIALVGLSILISAIMLFHAPNLYTESNIDINATKMGKIHIYQTCEECSVSKMSEINFKDEFLNQPPPNDKEYGTVYINKKKKFQKLEGFGGAFTEAAAINFFNLPKDTQNEVIDLYFGENGISYTLGRIPINSCDFSPSSYSFDKVDNDFSLEHFDHEVMHDQLNIIPLLKKAIDASTKANNNNNVMKFLASPWSPPAWMKVPVNGVQSMSGSADPSGLDPRPIVRNTWAKYISMWISAYKRNGVPIWALTPQNEPEFAAPWEACKYNATDEASFISDHLGPVIKGDHPDIKILAFDHNKDHLMHWTSTIMNSKAGEYVDGMAFHWYSGSSRLLDGAYGYEAVNQVSEFAPSKLLVNTEGCSCPGVRLGSWFRAERLAHDVMYDLINNAHGWIDWNLLVNSDGGINHVGNNCDAPLVTTPKFDGIVIQPKYYYMGHFSKFIAPGSVRVEVIAIGNFNYQMIDPSIQPGLELGLFDCEFSSRQMYFLDPLSQSLYTIPTLNPEISEEGVDSKPYYNLCIAPGEGYEDYQRPFVRLIDCDFHVSNPIKAKFKSTRLDDHNVLGRGEIGTVVDEYTQLCLTIANDMKGRGSLLVMSECQENKQSQLWSFTKHGTLVHSGDGDNKGLCVTSGWPLLSAVGFERPDGKVAIVVTNEGNAATQTSLVDAELGHIELEMPERSIRTVLY